MESATHCSVRYVVLSCAVLCFCCVAVVDAEERIVDSGRTPNAPCNFLTNQISLLINLITEKTLLS